MKDRVKVLIAYSIGVLLTGHIKDPRFVLDAGSFAQGINASTKLNKIAGSAPEVTAEDVDEVLETLSGLGLMEKQ